MRLFFGQTQMLILLFLMTFMPSLASAQVIHVQAYTEEWPPYNFIKKNEVTGISTDVLRAACELATLRCEQQLVPWARAYKTALETPNTIVYSIARIPARESQFIWIGPIAPRTTWVYARAEIANKIQSWKDLDNFRVGVIRDEASITELSDAGVAKSAIRVYNSNKDEMRSLKSGHLDVVVNTEIGMAMSLKQNDIAPEEVVKLMKLQDGGALYFGMNLQSDPVLVEKLSSSLEKLRRDGRVQAIVQQYLKQP